MIREKLTKTDFFWVYLFEKDLGGNLVPFSSSNFFIFPNLKNFLDENDNLKLQMVPDPSEAFFGFFFANSTIEKRQSPVRENNYFTYDT